MGVVSKRTSMTLFSDPVDHYSHRVRMVLAEKGVTVDVVDVDPGNKPDELGEINPYNNLPTLLDRDLVLYESTVIMEYLDERFPHPPLLPVYPVARALSRLWMHRIQNDWCQPRHPARRQGARDDAHQGAQGNCARASAIAVSPIFAEKPFFMSDEFTLVDCVVAPVLWRLDMIDIDLPGPSGPARCASTPSDCSSATASRPRSPSRSRRCRTTLAGMASSCSINVPICCARCATGSSTTAARRRSLGRRPGRGLRVPAAGDPRRQGRPQHLHHGHRRPRDRRRRCQLRRALRRRPPCRSLRAHDARCSRCSRARTAPAWRSTPRVVAQVDASMPSATDRRRTNAARRNGGGVAETAPWVGAGRVAAATASSVARPIPALAASSDRRGGRHLRRGEARSSERSSPTTYSNMRTTLRTPPVLRAISAASGSPSARRTGRAGRRPVLRHDLHVAARAWPRRRSGASSPCS